MSKGFSIGRLCRQGVLAISGFACAATGALAATDLIELKVDESAKAAVATSTLVFRHARPASHSGTSPKALEFRSTAAAGTAGSGANLTGNRYPADLDYHGGPVVTSLVSHSIFVNPSATCPVPGCWGDPVTFLNDLGQSKFVHIIDQYVGASHNNRYTTGVNFVTTFTPPATPLTDAFIQAIVASAVSVTGAVGYGNEYHVFLPPGQDLCFTSGSTICYSPDVPATFYFCAYHGSFDLPGVGHVLYSAEPYAAVPGCSDTGASPNGTVIDSTNNTLSHELFETITDPDGDAWTNTTGNGLYGEEIGDECSFVNATGFDPSIFHVNGKTYAAQPEYSNYTHACSTNPEY